jgi:sugar lactone lactonase YvrE
VLGGVVWVDRDFRAYGALRAIDATTGERRWEFRYATPTLAGVMSTASGLVFGGDNEGNFMAFDSRTGENLWSYPTGASIWGTAAMTHMLDGRQHVLIPSGGALIAFALDSPPNPYTALPQWPDPESAALGSVSAVYPNADGRVWVAERCGGNDCVGHDEVAPIRLYDASGRLLRAFGAGLFAWPHGLYVDAEGNVWVADARAGEGKGHQVLKMSATGEVLMRLGEAGVSGGDNAHFNGPTAVVVAPSGDIFVADGHELDSNNRIVKLARDGTFIKAWGGSGSAPGQFLVPHALALDSRGRLFVADRDNNRIQIFDQDGEFLEAWAQFGRPSGIFIDASDTLYVSDNQSNTERNPGWPRGIRVGSARDGTVTAFIPDPDFDPANAPETSAHGVAADAAGNIYGAEVQAQTVKKYVRR